MLQRRVTDTDVSVRPVQECVTLNQSERLTRGPGHDRRVSSWHLDSALAQEATNDVRLCHETCPVANRRSSESSVKLLCVTDASFAPTMDASWCLSML
jgi:hypothetical protein